MAVKENGFGELIPNAEVIVFDEAHQLPDIASQYFGQSVTSRQLFDLCKDIQITYRTEVKDMKQLGVAADQLLKIVQDFRLMLGEGNLRGNWRQMLQQSAVKKAFDFFIGKTEFHRRSGEIRLGAFTNAGQHF